MIIQCGILFAFLAAGELIVSLTGIPVPSSIIGMIMLTAALKCKAIDIRNVEKIADLLIRNLGFFFVPAGVGLMQCFGLLKGALLPIVAATAISTIVIIAVTGHVHHFTRNMLSEHRYNRLFTRR
ncbi:MAG: CidA/LrgA family protein [Bacteroides sp.]|nr:CidA/LrgA family protein [Bacteroides sp.]